MLSYRKKLNSIAPILLPINITLPSSTFTRTSIHSYPKYRHKPPEQNKNEQYAMNKRIQSILVNVKKDFALEMNVTKHENTNINIVLSIIFVCAVLLVVEGVKHT